MRYIRGKFNKVKNSFVGKGAGSILNFLENYNTVIENAIRVTTYHNLKKQGFSGARAAQAARNVTGPTPTPTPTLNLVLIATLERMPEVGTWQRSYTSEATCCVHYVWQGPGRISTP